MIEQQIKQYRALDAWFLTPLGNSVAIAFAHVLESVMKDLKGERLLQLGHCGNNSWLPAMNFKHKWIEAPASFKNNHHIQSALNQLPFPRNSLDCVLAPLSLEPFGSSLSVLDEIDRILKPMGYVVILSINPWSLWGAATKLRLLNCYEEPKIKLRTSFHLNRTFLQRGYRQYALSHFGYFPPSNACISKFPFFEEVGKMLWPFPSGFYCYIAQKYNYIHPSLAIQPLGQKVADDFKPSLQPAITAHRL